MKKKESSNSTKHGDPFQQFQVKNDLTQELVNLKIKVVHRSAIFYAHTEQQVEVGDIILYRKGIYQVVEVTDKVTLHSIHDSNDYVILVPNTVGNSWLTKEIDARIAEPQEIVAARNK